MKTNQAWGWLAAGVLAAGLNASYYDGGLQWAHRIADGAGRSSQAVVALASGHTDRFLSELRVLTSQDETASCPLTTTMAGVQTRIERYQARFDALSARREAQRAVFETNRVRIEAQTARLRIPAMTFEPAVVRVTGVSVCPRVRVNISQMPALKLPPMPAINIDTAAAGPI